MNTSSGREDIGNSGYDGGEGVIHEEARTLIIHGTTETYHRSHWPAMKRLDVALSIF